MKKLLLAGMALALGGWSARAEPGVIDWLLVGDPVGQLVDAHRYVLSDCIPNPVGDWSQCHLSAPNDLESMLLCRPLILRLFRQWRSSRLKFG